MALSKQRSTSGWSDLPPELLRLVVPRLHSRTDRVRIRAVCRPWRSGAHLHPSELPLPMPWLALGDRAYLDIVNNSVHKLILRVPADTTCRGSDDHLLFLTRASGGCFLASPFSSRAELPVADLAMFIKEETLGEMFSLSCSLSLHVHKVVLFWSPDGFPLEPLVAALIKDDTNELKTTTIFVCRAGKDTGVTKESYGSMSINLRLDYDSVQATDIAFFRGNLYALSTRNQLLAFELGEGYAEGNPTITGTEYVIRRPYIESEEEDVMVACEGIHQARDVHLVESGDQLLILKRWAIDDNGTSRGGRTNSFSVYKAVFGTRRWKTVRSLDGRALFLEQYGSKSVPIGDGHYGAQEDCIYFVRDGGDSGIYDLRNNKMRPLVPVTEVLQGHMRPWTPTWIFP